MLKQLTPHQYAELVGKEVSNIQKQVKRAYKNGTLLPHTLKIDRYSRFYLLTVNTDKEGKLI